MTKPGRFGGISGCLNKFWTTLSDVFAVWSRSPSLVLMCLAGGVRNIGGNVSGYYIANFFSPLMASNPALSADTEPCSFSFDPDFEGDQVLVFGVNWPSVTEF